MQATQIASDNGPVRRCIATRVALPVSSLIRFVVGPDHAVVPDVAGKLPGRGLWLRAERDIVDRACAANLFAKATGGIARPAADLSDQLERLLVRKCLDVVGLARRASQAVAGFEKVRGLLRSGRGAVLLVATDGAPDGRDKLSALLPDGPVVDVLSGVELGSVFARDHAVYAALTRGALADRLVREAERLAGFRRTPAAGRR